MKKNYTNKLQLLILSMALLIGTLSYSQNIELSFLNTTNTNDGADDFYETDVMIKTIAGQPDFKLGSGQLYIDYNTAAFGMNIDANGNSTITAVFGDGYFLGELLGFTAFYDVGDGIDNTSSTISWAFTQGVSSGAMTELVTATARKLFHLKIKYIDLGQSPGIMFNTTIIASTDQFYTACGPFDTPTTTLDCTADTSALNVPIQFVGATFDSTLDIEKDVLLSNAISIYPNPASDYISINSTIELERIQLYDLLGKQVISTVETEQIEISHLPVGVYLLKAFSESGTITKKIIIE